MDSGSEKVDLGNELSLSHGRRACSNLLKSLNLAMSMDAVHMAFPEHPAAVWRKCSSSGSQTSPWWMDRAHLHSCFTLS